MVHDINLLVHQAQSNNAHLTKNNIHQALQIDDQNQVGQLVWY
jgi:hypothetical protein